MHAFFAALFTSRLADVLFDLLRGGIRGTGKANASARTFRFAFATSTHRDGIPQLSSIEPRWRRRRGRAAQPVPTVNLLAPSRESRENGASLKKCCQARFFHKKSLSSYKITGTDLSGRNNRESSPSPQPASFLGPSYFDLFRFRKLAGWGNSSSEPRH